MSFLPSKKQSEQPSPGKAGGLLGLFMSKVSFFDKRILKKFFEITSGISGILSLVIIFVDIPKNWKFPVAGIFLALLAVIYLVIWLCSNNLNCININVEGSDVAIKVGNIFQQPGLKAIAFNEYFDTQVDNVIIAERSLNGIFIKNHLDIPVAELDGHIESYAFDHREKLEVNSHRKEGKKQKYQIGTICLYKEYILGHLEQPDNFGEI
ncbi:MAG: DUF6430 domain-containing protein [Candidatus Accumulibacter sp.]|nr:DUF6430 domain-containing protein [Accumulibacter sp.]